MTTARLTWNASVDNVAVVNYRLYRQIDNQPWDPSNPLATVSGATLTYDDATLTANHIYRWIVTAVDGVGQESQFSSLVTASTFPNDTVSAPQNLVAVPGTTSIDLSWDPPATITSVVKSYLIFRGSALVWSNLGNDLTWTDFNLTPGTQYSYYVIAVSPTDNQSPHSNTVTPTTLADTSAPQPPVAAPTATAQSSSSIFVDWDAFTDNVGVTAYQVLRGGLTIATLSGSQTSLLDTGLTPSTHYIYQIVALDAALNNSTPISCNATTPAQGGDTTSAPRSLAATPHLTTVDLTWQAPLTIPVSIRQYAILREGILAGATADGNTTTWTDTGLTPSTLHSYEVLAIAPSGSQSPHSNTVVTTTLADTTPPVVPVTAPTAVPTGPTGMLINWDAFTDNVGVLDYVLTRQGTMFASVPASQTVYIDSGLTPNTDYVYQIFARDAALNVSAAITCGARTPVSSNDQTSAPRNLVGTPHLQHNDLSWTAPATIPTSVARYVIERDNQMAGATANGSITTWTDTGLTPDTPHYYDVIAISAGGQTSPISNQILVRTLADTTPPQPPVAAPTATPTSDTGMLVNWDPFTDNVGVAGYQILRDNVPRISLTANNTAFIDSGLTANTTYHYKIIAVDDAFNGSVAISCQGTTLSAGGGGNIYKIPTTGPMAVDNTGTLDVTNRMIQFLASVPDGVSNLKPNIIVAPVNSLYRIEGIVEAYKRKNWIFRWNNSTIFCRTDGSYYRPFPGSAHAQWPAPRINFYLHMCSWVWMKDLIGMGANFPGNAHGCYGPFAEVYQASGTATIPTPTHNLLADITANQTTISIDSKVGFPTAPYYVCVGDMNADYEVMYVTSHSGSGPVTLNVIRAGDLGNACPSIYSKRRARALAEPNANTKVHLGRNGGSATVDMPNRPQGAFIVRLESQDIIQIAGNNQAGPPDGYFTGSDVYLDNVRTHYAFGDGIGVAQNCYRVFLTNSTFTHTGRQGVSPAGCDTVTFDNCHWDQIGRTVWDCEGAADLSTTRNVLWKNCSNGWATGNWMNVNGRGRGRTSPPWGITNIEVRNHYSQYHLQGVMCMDSKYGMDNPWGPYTLKNVISDNGADSPIGALRFRRCEGITIQGMYMPYFSGAYSNSNVGAIECESHCKGYDSSNTLQPMFIPKGGTNQNFDCHTNRNGSVGRSKPTDARGFPFRILFNKNIGSAIAPENYVPKQIDGSPCNMTWSGTDAGTPIPGT